MSGRRVSLPCGHAGTCVIGSFAVCDTKGCDGLSKRTCSKCHGKMYPFVASNIPAGTYACEACGAVRFEP